MKIKYTTIPASKVVPTLKTMKDGDFIMCEGASTTAIYQLSKISISDDMLHWGDWYAYDVNSIRFLSIEEKEHLVKKKNHRVIT